MAEQKSIFNPKLSTWLKTWYSARIRQSARLPMIWVLNIPSTLPECLRMRPGSHRMNSGI